MRNEKGQIAIELVLITGAVMVMAIAVYPFILEQTELNKATAAARDGATFGAAMRGMGYSSGSGNEAGAIKIHNLTMEPRSPLGDRKRYRIRFYIQIPEYMKDSPSCATSSIGQTITTQARRSIYYNFNGEWPPSGDLVNPVNTSTYQFTTACNWV